MLGTKSRQPIEFVIEPSVKSDIKTARLFTFDIPKVSIIYANRGYNEYAFEDYLELQRNINLHAKRKKNAKKMFTEKQEKLSKELLVLLQEAFLEKFMRLQIYNSHSW